MSLQNQRWILVDRVGREWMLSLAGPAGSGRSTAFDGVLEALVEAALAPWGRGDRGLACTLLAVHRALNGGSVDVDWPRGARALTTSLLRATRGGRLVVAPVAIPAARFEAPAPDTVRSDPPAAADDTTTFELLVVDEAGEPVGGIDIAFSVDGKSKTVPTNGAGIAKITDASASFGSARVVDPKAVRDILEPRWEQLRPIELPEDDEHASIRMLRDLDGASISLEAEVQSTLAIVPNHRRVRLVGMHFDTNKSFLLPSAMHGIRELHAIYEDADTTQFLVVGHTDAHGTREYNEKVSLERAKSIIAFMKDDADTWNANFSLSAPEKRWGDREVKAMMSALPEGTPAFATRRELIEAYMALDHTSLPSGASIVAHGCGPNHPPPDEGNVPPTDAEMRRVDIFAFDGPIRPPPPGEISGPGSPEYDQWVAQMQSTFDVRTDILPFRYAMQIGPDQQWSEAAKLTVLSEDLVDHESFVLSDGEAVDTYRIFEFSGIRPGVRYRADITEGDLEVELFAFTELHAVALFDDDEDHLNPPPADPAAPFDSDDDPPDTGVLNVRLFDADGKPMTHALYRLSVAGEALGYSEDGFASIRLPSPCPPTGILEWGEPDDDGELELRMEIALDCDDGPDRTSSMLHNLGYPKDLPLDTRVRAFQSEHAVNESGLGPTGAVPPATKAAITQLYRQRVE